jgi:hypothetical protein
MAPLGIGVDDAGLFSIRRPKAYKLHISLDQ